MYVSDVPVVNVELLDNEIPWKIAVSVSDTDKFEQVSFVNGIATPKGGKHVDHIAKQLTAGLKVLIKKKTILLYHLECSFFETD